MLLSCSYYYYYSIYPRTIQIYLQKKLLAHGLMYARKCLHEGSELLTVYSNIVYDEFDNKGHNEGGIPC